MTPNKSIRNRQHIDVQCEHCSIIFSCNHYQVSRKNKRRRFCSDVCRLAWGRIEATRPRPCRVCGVPISEKLKGVGWVCSFKCFRSTLSKKEKVCAFCSKIFETAEKTTHCSWECYQKSKGEKIYKECPACKKLFCKRANCYTKAAIFCSQECSNIYRRGKNNPRYRGKRRSDRGITWKEQREEARLRDGERCLSIIHDPNFKQSKKYSIDHVVPYRAVMGWRKLGENLDPNDISNLASLCLRCHVIKTMTIESHLVEGDIRSFIDAIRVFFPTEVTEPALRLYGLLDPNRPITLVKDWDYERRTRPKQLLNFQGEKSANSKLNESQVLEIIRRRDEPRGPLAKEFGVAAAYLGLIIRGHTWTYIERPYLVDGRYPVRKGPRPATAL